METRLLKVVQAAALAGVGRTVAYEFVHAGIWPSVKIGRVVRIPRSGLDAWIEEQERKANENAARIRGEA